MDPVLYDKKVIADLDGILSASVQILDTVKAAMALEKVDAGVINHLQDLREGLVEQLASYDRGLFIPEEKRVALADREDEATDLLGKLQRDDQTYECPEFRRLRQSGLVARIKLLEMAESGT